MEQISTKEQERKALAKIKKIVDELGEDSYIGTAFKGCFEIAETNIENDWGCSLQDDRDDLQTVATLRKIEIDSLKEELEKKQKEISELHEEIASRDVKIADMFQEIGQLKWEAINEVKEVHLTVGDEGSLSRFKKLSFHHGDIDFVTIIQPDDWTQSYRLSDIRELTIE